MSGNPIRYFEPNELDYNAEDLSIGISLKIQYMDRSLIANTEINGSVNILYGDENNNFLTTSYSDVTVLELEGGGNKESIGIENITIKYNTWYFPEVSMKFVDVRGNSVFNPMEMTNDSATKGTAKGSFLKAFFSFPYPIFYLTVKGFFGKPITYRLTVKDVPRAVFNSSTGNFELSVNFIGHMYYYLTDIPMSLVTLAPYIEYDGNNANMGNFQNSTTNIPTFIKFIKDTAAATKNIHSDEEYNNLQIEYDKVKEKYNIIERMLKLFNELEYFLDRCYKRKQNENDANKYTFEIKKDADKDILNTINKIIDEIEQKFKNRTISWDTIIFHKNSNYYFVTGESRYYNYETDIKTLEELLSDIAAKLQEIEKNILEREEKIVETTYLYTPTLKDVIEMTLSHLDKLRKNMAKCLNNILNDANNRKLSKIKKYKTDCNVVNNEITAFPFISFLNDNGEYVWIGETEANTFSERNFIENILRKTTKFQEDVKKAEDEFNFSESLIKNYPSTGLRSFILDSNVNQYEKEMNEAGGILNYCKQTTSDLPPVFKTIAERFVLSYFTNDAEYSTNVLPKIEMLKLLNCGFDKEVYNMQSVWGNTDMSNIYAQFWEACSKYFKEKILNTSWKLENAFYASHRVTQDEGSPVNSMSGGNAHVYSRTITVGGTKFFIWRIVATGNDCTWFIDWQDVINGGWDCVAFLKQRYYILSNFRPYKEGNEETFLTENSKAVKFLMENKVPIDEYLKMFPTVTPQLTKLVSVTTANFVVDGEDIIIGDAGGSNNFNNVDTWCQSKTKEHKAVKFKNPISIENFDTATSDEICKAFINCLKFEQNEAAVIEAEQRGGYQLFSIFSVCYLGLQYSSKISQHGPTSEIANRTTEEAVNLLQTDIYKYQHLNRYKILYDEVKERLSKLIKDFFNNVYNNDKLSAEDKNFQMRKFLRTGIAVGGNKYMPNIGNETNPCDIMEDLEAASTTYIDNFLNAIRTQLLLKLDEEEPRVDTSLSDERKLSIYDIFKNLYDRWKYGAEEINNEGSNHDKITINDFVFRDSLGRDISNELNINIENVISILLEISKGERNMTAYEFIYEICKQADCLLLPLPGGVFANTESKESLKSLFTPYNYSYVANDDLDSKFIVTYRQKDSQHLNFSPNESSYADDGIDFTNENVAPDINAGAFGVTYGFNKQRFFKNVQVSMDKPQVTEQSISTTLFIAENGDKEGSRKLGVSYHDIFDTFSNHSYQCSVEMMGNAQIMPMMYFQLNNIPFFKGGYMITSVEHEIKNGNMTTKFTGNRLNVNQFKIKNQPITINIEGNGEQTEIDYSEIGGDFVSNYFTLAELTYSSYAKTHNLNNTPGKAEIKKLQKLATDILDKIRAKYGKPIIVNSGFRSKRVNEGVGGSKNSQHRTGEAADIQTKNDVENGILFKLIERMILDGEITVGQLIWEHGDCERPDWIHVSLPTSTKKNDLLRAKRDGNGKTYYVVYVEC